MASGDLYDKILEWGAHLWDGEEKVCELLDDLGTEVDYNECREILEELSRGDELTKVVRGYTVSGDGIFVSVKLLHHAGYYLYEEKGTPDWHSISLIPYGDDRCRVLISYTIRLAHIEALLEHLGAPEEEIERLWRARMDLAGCEDEVDATFSAVAQAALLNKKAFRVLKWLRPEYMEDQLVEEVIKAWRNRAPA